MRLRGKTAVVTGASRGIGRAIAMTFAKEGAKVVVNFVQASSEAQKVVDEIKAIGGEAIALKADVSLRGQAETLIAGATKAFGGLQILVNNAGIPSNGGILDTTESNWDRTIAVNLKGPFNCMQAASKLMVGQHYGKIINISSIAALGGAPKGELAYSAAKAALINLTMVSAAELGPHRINVNCIAPGFTQTDFHVRNAGGMEKFRVIAERKSGVTNLGRIGQPQDIANVALFLACDESSFITGQVIVVDGGRQDFLSHA
jgi:3-oxoacyl-[acyl-carrier protein] reductase